MKNDYLRKPEWLKISLKTDTQFQKVQDILSEHSVNTICTSGSCPNKNECFSRGTATIMILGNICTRHCKFCNVEAGIPVALDKTEPIRVANTVKALKLKHCVLTSVDRDDLSDFGASQWAATIKEIRSKCPDTSIEALIPDFNDNKNCIDMVIAEKPNIISHNLETVERITPILRSKASYRRSLAVLKYIADNGITTKSGIMLGVGEMEEEVLQTIDDLIENNCRILTIGQYLQPTKKHYKVKEYVPPEKFEEYRMIALEKGCVYVESAPLVRSSYFAEKHISLDN